MKNKILYKNTRALYLSICSDNEDFHRNYEMMTNGIEPLEKNFKSLYLINKRINDEEKINFIDFINLYYSDSFFNNLRKEGLVEENIFILRKFFLHRKEKRLFEYINDRNIFGHLSFIMSVLFVNYIRICKKKLMLIFYGYQETDYRINKDFEALIQEATRNTTELSIVKKQFSLEEIKQVFLTLDFRFIPGNISYEIFLFGSKAIGKNDNTSDIDIAIIYKERNQFIDIIEKTFYEILKEKFEYVDIVSICLDTNLSSFEKRIMKQFIKLR